MEKLEGLTNLAPELIIQSLKASERHGELRRLEVTLSHLKDRVREARLEPGAATNGVATQLGEYADTLGSISRQMREFLANFSDDRVRLNLITEELRQSVIELTMLPLSTVFDAFPRAVRGGFVGVDVFFVISGYLISGILFRELDAGRVDLVDFYARRVRRIFPQQEPVPY